LKKTLKLLTFEAVKGSEDLSVALATALVTYGLSELVHKILEGKITQEALLIDPEIDDVQLRQLFYAENIDTDPEAFVKYLYRTNDV